MSLHCPDCGESMHQETDNTWFCQTDGCPEWSWCQLCQEVRRTDEMQRPLFDRCCRACHITHYMGAELRCDPMLREDLERLLDGRRKRGGLTA